MLCQIFTQHAAWGKQLMHRWVCRIVEWTKGILSISNQGKHIQLYGRRVMPFYLLCLATQPYLLRDAADDFTKVNVCGSPYDPKAIL